MMRFKKWFQDLNMLKPGMVIPTLWLGFAFLYFGLFLKLTWELREDNKIDELDKQFLAWISNLRISSVNGPTVDLTAMGSTTIITLVSVVGILMMSLRRDFRAALYLIVGSIGAGVGTFGLKEVFTRDRPTLVPRLVEVTGFSYPSGHALASTTVYLLFMFLAWRSYPSWMHRLILLIFTLTLVAGISFSRLYLGVHYPSDVLSGLLLGAAWVCFLTSFFSRYAKS